MSRIPLLAIVVGILAMVAPVMTPAAAWARDVPPWHGGGTPSVPPLPVPAPPSPPPIDVTGLFVPRGPAARFYNDQGLMAASPSPLAARVADTVDQLARSAGKPAPVEDGRLDAVASDMVNLVGGDRPPAYDALSFALNYHGIVEPSPHIVVLQMTTGDEDGLIAQLRQEIPGLIGGARIARLGVGVVTDRSLTTVVVALQESAVKMDPIARALPAGGRTRLHAKVLAPFARPEVMVTRQGGQVTQSSLVSDGAGGVTTDIACGTTTGKLEIEIAAVDASGSPAVLANFPIWCGWQPPASMRIVAPQSAPSDVAGTEKTLFAMLNEDRRRAGLQGLAWDPRVADVARAHSTEMRDKGYVAHVSPITGTSSDRVHRAGISTPVVLENIARAYSADEADRGLMNSPGHRANILSTQATDVGIGVALGEPSGGQREVYVTQVFIRKAPIVDHQHAVDAARAALGRARTDAHLANLADNLDLDRIADGYAARLASGKKDETDKGVNRELNAFTGTFKEVITQVTITADPDDPPRGSAVDPAFHFAGVGVAQGFHADLGEGAYYVVLLLAR